MPSDDQRRIRKAIIDACRAMNKAGINQGTSGNVSARADDGFIITPSGIPYERMTADMIVQMDMEGGYVGDYLPSSEWRMHYDIFRTRGDAGAVVHLHSTYATALSCLRVGIPAFHYMIAVAGGTDIRCADYATFGTQALSDNMLKALDGRRACLLANHGMICLAGELRGAIALAIEVETLARQYWHARLLGEPVLLDDGEMANVLARFQSYGKQASDLGEGEAPAFELPPRRDVPPVAKPGKKTKKSKRS